MNFLSFASSLHLLSRLRAFLVWEKPNKPSSNDTVSSIEAQSLHDSSEPTWPPQNGVALVQQTVNAVLAVLGGYRLARDDSVHWDTATVSNQVRSFVTANKPIGLVLPAFPFKSPNRTDKVLGALPDAGEELALMHLNGLASAILRIYAHGAVISIVSDGLVYNDILGVSDEEVWEYGQALRQMTIDHDLCHLRFLRQHDIFDCGIDPNTVSKAQYLQNVSKLREHLISRIPSEAALDEMIATDLDTTLVYRGYLKFLELDLATDSTGKSKARFKKHIREVARKMIARGYAFRGGIAVKYPGHVRLSIHPSTDITKLFIPLTSQKGGQLQTPWHSTLVRSVNGSITMSHRAAVNSKTHDLISDCGRPSYFRERSPLFDWPGMELNFRYLYPTGIVVSAAEEGKSYSIKDVPMKKLRELATQCSPVILRGFQDTTDEEIFIASAHELGTPAPWTFGIKASVKNAHGTNPDVGNAIVTSSEAMPMHQDGVFFLKPVRQPDGTTKMQAAQPRFQYFSSIACAARGTGYTLFASSRLLFQHLGSPHTVEDLRKLTWDCRHSSNSAEHMTNLPLVVPHPETGADCLNFLEPWPQHKTRFAYNSISIENGPQSYLDVVTTALYDPRVTLRFEWCQGDVLASDNMAMLHTRTAFHEAEKRELWRIHVN